MSSRQTSLKRIARLVAGGTPSVDEPRFWSEDSGTPWVTIGDMTGQSTVRQTERRLTEEGIASKRLPLGRTGTVLFAMYASVGAVSVLDTDASWNQAILGIEPVASLAERRFLMYWLLSLRPQLERYFRSNTQDNLNAEQVGNLPYPVLSVEQQRAIADFLDAETARIDALIAKKRQLIERLNQRLNVKHEQLMLGQDQVQHEATNGDFYGATPWPETALRHLNCEVQTGPFGSQLHAEEYVKDGWPVVNPANIIGGQIVALPDVSVDDETRHRLVRHVLKPGDIVFGRRGEMGRAGLVHDREAGWVCGTGSLRLRLLEDRLLPQYLKLLLETSAAKKYFQLSSVGSTMDNLNTEILLALPVLVPPVETQVRIVNAVSRSRGHNLELVTKLRRSVELLTEHRQALITAVATGQLKVPGAAA